VLGDLAELGDDAQALHRQLGERAAALGIDRLLTVGRFSGIAGDAFDRDHRHFADRAALTGALLDELSEDDSVLIKGSRSSRMDEVVAGLRRQELAC
jgi:UDP-N-acetylmuramoyl-tripeptide--D-alanyl-D-alanine ligase